MPTKANVIAGKPKVTGGIFWAPPETAVPTDATTALAAGFVERGFVGADGITMSISKSNEKIKDWGGSTVRVIQSEHEVQFTGEYLEFSLSSAADFFGPDNVTGTDETMTVHVNAKEVPPGRYVLEVEDGDVWIRVVIPDGKPGGEGGDFTFASTDVIRIPLTIEALPDDATGDNALIYKAPKPVGP